MKLSNLRTKHIKNHTWPVEKKIQAVTQYLALGNMALVSATTGVSHDLLRQWKMQPWWKEYEAQIRNTDNLKLDTKLTSIVERSLEAVADRLENGEAVFNQKTGEIVKRPVSMRDAARVSVDLLAKRELLRKSEDSGNTEQQTSVADQLKNLAMEFAKWQRGPVRTIEAEVTDVTPKENLDAESEGDEADQVDESSNLANSVYDSDHGEGLEPTPEEQQNNTRMVQG